MIYAFSIRKIYNAAAETLMAFDYDEHDAFIAADLEMLLMLLVYSDYIESGEAESTIIEEVMNTVDSILEQYVYEDDDYVIVRANDAPKSMRRIKTLADMETYIYDKTLEIYNRMIKHEIVYSTDFQRLARQMREIIYDYTESKMYSTDTAVINHTTKAINITMKI